ncbi:MAG: hypothetical protein L0Z50_32790 [Verrucomicrobiales bacterium]|nr:hypothetical protein [Verrucomicrobiales bacterium]
MKAKRAKPISPAPAELNEQAVPSSASGPGEPMIRTQVYLTPAEYQFLQAEGERRKEPMAAVLRSIIDEKMRLPEDAWTDNPMLRPTPKDAQFELPEDAAINHDNYLYGTPKKYVKVKGRWVLAEEARS